MATTPERIECVALSEVRATCRSTLVSRRPRDRVREPGTGPNHDLACVDQVVVTRVVLRFQLPHQALAELYDTRRSAAAYVGGLFAHAMTTTAAAADPSADHGGTRHRRAEAAAVAARLARPSGIPATLSRDCTVLRE